MRAAASTEHPSESVTSHVTDSRAHSYPSCSGRHLTTHISLSQPLPSLPGPSVRAAGELRELQQLGLVLELLVRELEDELRELVQEPGELLEEGVQLLEELSAVGEMQNLF